MEQSLNLIFKLDIAEQCLMYRKALSRVSFIYSASQPAIMITLINILVGEMEAEEIALLPPPVEVAD